MVFTISINRFTSFNFKEMNIDYLKGVASIVCMKTGPEEGQMHIYTYKSKLITLNVPPEGWTDKSIYESLQSGC